MSIVYKLNVIEELKKHGHNTSTIRKQNLMGQQTLRNVIEGKPITFETLNTICKLCNLQPGDIIEYVED